MSLRIGCDMDGVLADFSSAYHAVEDRLFGAHKKDTRPGNPEEEAPERPPASKRPATTRRRKDAIWNAIRETPDFWTTLHETEPGIVKRLQEVSVRLRWEVFFITQRPATAGDTVQRQTQKWLIAHGFDMPSVVVVPGSRGAAAAALSLDYHLDDSAQNCVDVTSDSKARILLIVDDANTVAIESARRLHIGTTPSTGAALDILEKACAPGSHPGVFGKLARLVGWK